MRARGLDAVEGARSFVDYRVLGLSLVSQAQQLRLGGGDCAYVDGIRVGVRVPGHGIGAAIVFKVEPVVAVRIAENEFLELAARRGASIVACEVAARRDEDVQEAALDVEKTAVGRLVSATVPIFVMSMDYGLGCLTHV